jgi:SdpC family antimicrobial peptide
MKKFIPSKLKFAAILFLALFTIVAICWTRPSNSSASFSGEELFRGIIFMDGPVSDQIPELKEKTEIKKIFAKDQSQEAQVRKMEDLIIMAVNKYDPRYFKEFRSVMTSGDPVRINEQLNKTEDVVIRSLASYLDIKLDDLKSAKDQINSILGKNQIKFQAAIADLQSGKISEKEFMCQTQKILNSDNDIVAFLVKDKKKIAAFSDPNSELCGCAIALTFAACNVAIAINVAGYINVALAANVAAAINVAVAINVTVKVNKQEELSSTSSQLDKEYFINSIATRFKAA